MKVTEIITEGGWANPVTQGTKITPAVVEVALKALHQFAINLNKFLQTKDLSPIEIGNPCGSTTYYKRDLEQNPTREYGDIDVNVFIPRIKETSNNANAEMYKHAIKEFCDSSKDYQTQNGTNVIFNLGGKYVQVDFIMAYYENKEWTKALAPAYNVKGVLCGSIYSSLGEALHLSIGGAHGVQVKTVGGKRVPFNQSKGATLSTITNDPKSWAVDIAKHFGAKRLSPRLKATPGVVGGEVRVANMVNSVRGIAETLELNKCLPEEYNSADELIQTVKNIYLDKIQKAIQSSKFAKAATPDAVAKAEETKKMLAAKSAQIATLFGV